MTCPETVVAATVDCEVVSGDAETRPSGFGICSDWALEGQLPYFHVRAAVQFKLRVASLMAFSGGITITGRAGPLKKPLQTHISLFFPASMWFELGHRHEDQGLCQDSERQHRCYPVRVIGHELLPVRRHQLRRRQQLPGDAPRLLSSCDARAKHSARPRGTLPTLKAFLPPLS